MLISYTRLINSPILSLQTGAPLGTATEPIIDPRQLNVVAFYCTGPRIQGTAVLHVADIREVSNMGFIVDDADVLMPPDDLVRLKEVVDMQFALLNKKVVDTNKRVLGKVDGYSLDLDSFYIMKLNVRQSLIRNFMGGNLLIDRTQIVEINDKRILVKAPNVHVEQKQRLSPIIDNPFRHRGAPQPDGSQAKVAQD